MVCTLLTLPLLLFQSSTAPRGAAEKVQTASPDMVQPVSALQEKAAGRSLVPATDNYALGPGDQILIKVLDFEEIDNKPVVIDSRGAINLPEVGKIQAAGLTPDQLEAVITDHLKKFLLHPNVSVTVGEIHSQRVSVLGEVRSPGVHTLQGDPTLFEVLSSAGGLQSGAGYTVLITRHVDQGPIPLPNAHPDESGQFSVASVSVTSIMTASNPRENIHVKPNDVITVPRGAIIYVIGAVRKSGGFLLNEHQSLSALRIMSLAEGLDKTAAGDRARIMRQVPGSENHQEIPIDLKKILAGKVPDVPLQADDVLFVPVSAGKATGYRTLDILGMSAGALLYRVP
jgi:polysaccharide biosynthesis/export protein